MANSQHLHRVYDVLTIYRKHLGLGESVCIASHEEDPSNFTARLHGVITASRRGGSQRRFYDLLDPTGAIQLEARKGIIDESDWGALAHISKGSRVYVEGSLGPTSPAGQPTILLSRVPEKAQEFRGSLDKIQPNYRSVGNRIFVARLRSLFEEAINSRGYLRLESRTLSASWSEIDEVAIRALYPGLGRPMYLSPSPHAQLVEALIATGADKVYASTNSFVSVYRGELDGVESAIIYAKSLGAEQTDLLEDTRAILQHVLSGMDMTTTNVADLPIREQTNHKANEFTPLCDEAEIQIFQDFDGSRARGESCDIFRVILSAGVIPAEGITQRFPDGIPIGTLTFHPERLLPLLEHLPIRRLEHPSLDG